jgi:chromosome segregation ATPase
VAAELESRLALALQEQEQITSAIEDVKGEIETIRANPEQATRLGTSVTQRLAVLNGTRSQLEQQLADAWGECRRMTELKARAHVNSRSLMTEEEQALKQTEQVRNRILQLESRIEDEEAKREAAFE